MQHAALIAHGVSRMRACRAGPAGRQSLHGFGDAQKDVNGVFRTIDAKAWIPTAPLNAVANFLAVSGYFVVREDLVAPAMGRALALCSQAEQVPSRVRDIQAEDLLALLSGADGWGLAEVGDHRPVTQSVVLTQRMVQDGAVSTGTALTIAATAVRIYRDLVEVPEHVDESVGTLIANAARCGACGAPQPLLDGLLWDVIVALSPPASNPAEREPVIFASKRWPAVTRQLAALLQVSASESSPRSSERDWRVLAKAYRWALVAEQPNLPWTGDKLFAHASRFQLHGSVQLAEELLARRGKAPCVDQANEHTRIRDGRVLRALLMRAGDLLRRSAFEPDAGPSKTPSLDTVRFAGRWIKAASLALRRGVVGGTFADRAAPWLAGLDAACTIMHLHPPTCQALRQELIQHRDLDPVHARIVSGLLQAPAPIHDRR